MSDTNNKTNKKSPDNTGDLPKQKIKKIKNKDLKNSDLKEVENLDLINETANIRF